MSWRTAKTRRVVTAASVRAAQVGLQLSALPLHTNRETLCDLAAAGTAHDRRRVEHAGRQANLVELIDLIGGREREELARTLVGSPPVPATGDHLRVQRAARS